jgi:hypothetical protein
VHYTFLKFNITGLSGDLQQAKLRLFVVNSSNQGGSFYLVSNNFNNSSQPWTEEGMLWDNAPIISGSPLVTIGAVSLNSFVEVDVTSAISGNGTYSFAIKTSSSDLVTYSSKEGPADPELILETGGSSSPPPSISSFSPTSGTVGSAVTITGFNFIGVSSVKFNGVTASGFVIDSDSQIRVNVPAGAASGKISLTNATGTATSSTDFTVLAPPTIASFTPTSGPIGTSVTILGNNFTGVTAVSFNGISAAIFTVDSASQIRAVVPAGATTGKIRITTGSGTGTSLTDFVVSTPAATLTFRPIHDSFVRSAQPLNNYGSQVELRVRRPQGDSTITYLKFSVAGLAGPVSSAKIRASVLEASVEGGSIFSVSNNYKNTVTPWIESGLTWGNAPKLTVPVLSSLGAVSVGQTVEWDVTAAITGDGTYSFAIINTVDDIAKYSSKEGVTSPQLIIQTGSALAASQVATVEPEKIAALTNEPSTLLPETLVLKPNYPNPFNLETSIEYGLPEATHARLVIFNILGQEVRTLVEGFQAAGFKTIRWDGRDNSGNEISSGVYVMRLENGKQKLTRKITLQK